MIEDGFLAPSLKTRFDNQSGTKTEFVHLPQPARDLSPHGLPALRRAAREDCFLVGLFFVRAGELGFPASLRTCVAVVGR